MAKPNTTWRVLPHGGIEDLDQDLWTVVGRLKMPLGETTRRMTIVRLRDGGLVIHSAIALDDAHMRRIESLGEPRHLVVPSGIHRLDAAPWRARYPSMRVIAPAGARDAVHAVAPIDATSASLDEGRVVIAPVHGTGERELAMIVGSAGGTTLVLNDIVFNLPAVPGVAGLGLRLLGFHPGRPAIPTLVRKKLSVDDHALAAQLRAWAALPGLSRVLVAHGAPLPSPRATLRALAEEIAPRAVPHAPVSQPAR